MRDHGQVRSDTLAGMMFMMPMPPTTSEIPPIPAMCRPSAVHTWRAEERGAGRSILAQSHRDGRERLRGASCIHPHIPSNFPFAK